MNILTTMKNITKMCGKQTKIKTCFIRTRIEKHCHDLFHDVSSTSNEDKDTFYVCSQIIKHEHS